MFETFVATQIYKRKPMAQSCQAIGNWIPSNWKKRSTKKTKIFLLNTPHNPVGKVFSKDELEMIAGLCKKWNVLVISDEVYEWMVYEPFKHIRIATLPDMWERTITIGSAGKTFSVTGWKTGWAYGPAHLIHNLQVVHQNNLNSINTPTQEAIARSLEEEVARRDSPDCYLVSLARELRGKRDFMAKFMTEIGMVPTIPEGGYFMMVDWTPLGIPPSAFYSEEHKHLGENHIRYCFIKIRSLPRERGGGGPRAMGWLVWEDFRERSSAPASIIVYSRRNGDSRTKLVEFEEVESTSLRIA
ncbi:unnamed protein product, partial [Nesidiocoris tenuis]